nr:hypothetical protein [Nakamurella flavida]
MLAAFVLTFLLTRIITRSIRAGVGPFRNNVSASGTHVHHAVPGIILLIAGAITAIAAPGSPWIESAAVVVGVGMSLVLDEFALILHLQDVYWSAEGRVSVELIGLTTAVLGLWLIGFSPFGELDVSVSGIVLQLTFTAALILHGVLALVAVLKGKYRSALISTFVPIVAWVTAVRLARPGSWWARHNYGPKRMARAVARAAKTDARWDPRWGWLGDLVAGSPSLAVPSPPPGALPSSPVTLPADGSVPTEGSAPADTRTAPPR